MSKKIKKTKKKSEPSSKVNKSSNLKDRENRQLIWFFIVILMVFAAFLIPYFYTESLNKFNYEHINWTIKKSGEDKIYHGRFLTLNGLENIHNIFLRHDPRENNVTVNGKLDNFKFGGFVSISPEADECRGDIPRAMVDLFSFLLDGIGMADVKVATTNKELANRTEKIFVDCSYNQSRTIIILDKTQENKIEVSKENPNCYKINIKSCTDFTSIEKFIFKSVSDFREKYG